MDIQRIRYFLEVARLKNFSKAAKVCHISQPSLSQQIMKLEEEVSGVLFLRNRGNIELTEHGRAFLKHANAIMAEVQTAREFVLESQGNTEATIRFGALPTIAPYMIPQIFAQIKTVLPKAKLELREDLTASLVEALRNDAIDFALLSPKTDVDKEPDSLLLKKDRLILTMPEDYNPGKTGKISISQLRKKQAILLEHSHCLSTQAASYCEAVGLNSEITIRASQIETLLGLVENGFGFTFTPEIAIPHHTYRKVSYHQIATGPPYYREIRLYWMKRHILTRWQATVVRCLKNLGTMQ